MLTHFGRARSRKHRSRSPRLLRAEQLESRTVLAALSPLASLHQLASLPCVYDPTTLNAAPTVGKAAVVLPPGSPSSSAAPSATPSPAVSPTASGLKDPVLAGLVQKFNLDGSLNRAEMIQILASIGAGGTVSATDLSDLRTILANAAQYNMPNYVQVLASDVVNGNPANAYYQGAPLGNLAAGSSAAQLDDLIGKWFLGTDLPALTSSSLTYTMASGSLFPATPSHNDEHQGGLGDCYFISALGAIADSNPAAIKNMFIDNGDGTYTVRFYGGTYSYFLGGIIAGFTNNTGTADYVTVNCALPTYSGGTFAYADSGSSASSQTNALWIPLAEKAYAEWNQTGKEGRDGQNSYGSIQSGWMTAVDAQVLGHNATDYFPSNATRTMMVNALAANQAVTIGTDTSNNSADTLSYGLVGSHAYAVIGYNAATGLFTLYNPWGFDQPGALSWSQLEATCDGFVTAVTPGSASISNTNGQLPRIGASRVTAGATPISSTGQSSKAPVSLVAAGVDAVLASQDPGDFPSVARRFLDAEEFYLWSQPGA